MSSPELALGYENFYVFRPLLPGHAPWLEDVRISLSQIPSFEMTPYVPCISLVNKQEASYLSGSGLTPEELEAEVRQALAAEKYPLPHQVAYNRVLSDRPELWLISGSARGMSYKIRRAINAVTSSHNGYEYLSSAVTRHPNMKLGEETQYPDTVAAARILTRAGVLNQKLTFAPPTVGNFKARSLTELLDTTPADSEDPATPPEVMMPDTVAPTPPGSTHSPLERAIFEALGSVRGAYAEHLLIDEVRKQGFAHDEIWPTLKDLVHAEKIRRLDDERRGSLFKLPPASPA